jgi:hypothetical protein
MTLADCWFRDWSPADSHLDIRSRSARFATARSEALLAAAQRGNHDAFSALVSPQASSFRPVARRLTRNPADAFNRRIDNKRFCHRSWEICFLGFRGCLRTLRTPRTNSRGHATQHSNEDHWQGASFQSLHERLRPGNAPRPSRGFATAIELVSFRSPSTSTRISQPQWVHCRHRNDLRCGAGPKDVLRGCAGRGCCCRRFRTHDPHGTLKNDLNFEFSVRRAEI